MRMLAELTIQIAEAPWKLTRDHMTRAMAAGLSEEDILHVVLIDALFGHLNRIADATGVALDYDVKLQPPDRSKRAAVAVRTEVDDASKRDRSRAPSRNGSRPHRVAQLRFSSRRTDHAPATDPARALGRGLAR